MTVSARMALNDCRCALSKHTPELVAEEFRVSWVAVVSLLRAIGHILEKVDSRRSVYLKQAIDAAWGDLQREKPKPEIFHEFIEKERNNVLKSYEIGVSRILGETDAPGQLNVHIDLDSMQGKPGRVARIAFSDPVVIKSKIASGPFHGRSELEVAAEAIEWWEQYLDMVDCEAARLAKLRP